jgi:allantoicase
MGRRGMHIGNGWESQKERDYEDYDVGEWIILKLILER